MNEWINENRSKRNNALHENTHLLTMIEEINSLKNQRLTIDLVEEWVMNKWMYEWMNKWMNEWMNEWLNEWINK